MNAPETRLAKPGCEPRPCAWCGGTFAPKRNHGHARFCATRCRNAFHQAERVRETQRAAGPELYEALLSLRAAVRSGFEDRDATDRALVAADAALSKAGYKEPKP